MPKSKIKDNYLNENLDKNKQTRVSKERKLKSTARLKETESSVCGGTQHITNASPVGIHCDDQSRGEKLLDKNKMKVTSIYIPVVSSTGSPLMPCHPARARELITKGKAKKQFRYGIMYIKLLERKDGELQRVGCGIDPEIMREGITVKSENRTFINILSETHNIRKPDGDQGSINMIQSRILARREYRANRRKRKTPYRKCRFNRKCGQLSPSLKARWQLKIRIVNILRKLYPISDYVVEDVKAKMKDGKENKKWNITFTQMQIGKNLFYNEIGRFGNLILKSGLETFNIRNKLGLIKTTNKLDDVFSAHNIDSWVLANSIFNVQTKPDNEKIWKFSPIVFHRRQLFYYQTQKNGKRKRFGGTISDGIVRGSVYKYKPSNKSKIKDKYVYIRIGGWQIPKGSNKIKLTGHDIITDKRIFRSINKEDLDCMYYIAKWYVKEL